MTYKELQNVSHKIRAAATLEAFAPRKSRRRLKEILVLIAPIVIILSMFFSKEAYLTISRLYGILFSLLFLWLILFMLDTFFYSMYFRGIRTTLPEHGFSHKVSQVPFEVLYIVFGSDPEDVTAGFINSAVGETVFLRLDIHKEKTEHFLAERKMRVNGNKLNFQGEPTLASYVGTLYDADQEFSKFLSGFGFRRAEITGAADWVARTIESEKTHLRWWGRDSLGRIRGIGKEWAHGETHHLEKYGKYLTGGEFSLGEDAYIKEVHALERVLLRSEGAGALIVGEDNDDALEVVRGLADQITGGTVLPDIEHKRIFYLDSKTFVRATGSKTDFGKELINILEEALKAEHIIFVIPNFSAFIDDAKSFGVDAMDVLGPYLRSSGLQIIALSDKNSFINSLEKNIELMSRFEKILVTDHGREAVLHSLEEKVAKVERENKLFFTYPALVAITPDPDILTKLVQKMIQNKKTKVQAADVMELIK